MPLTIHINLRSHFLRVIIHIEFIDIEYPMLHAKFQGHRTSGSGEEDLLTVLPFMGIATILIT